MPFIILNEDQAQVVSSSSEVIELRDRTGKVLAHVEPAIAEAEITEAKRRLASDQRRWPSARVQELLATLTQTRARHGMDETKLGEILERFRSGEPS